MIMNQDLLRKFGSAWMIFGLLSCVLALCLPWIGWYALGNIAVVCAAAYVLHLAGGRRKRIDQNKDLTRKMNAAQRRKLAEMDQQEGKNLLVLGNRLVPFLCVFCAVINIYTYIWSMSGHPQVPVFSGLEHAGMPVYWLMLSLNLLFLGLFWFAFRIRFQDLMD